MSKPFHFKQFSIIQEQSAMKVGFDGVILGAWCDILEGNSYLDLGTGTGLIALMLAQRNLQADITAIETDKKAIREAQFNFRQSAFNQRINAVHANFIKWDSTQQYHHVVSNPPFFTEKVAAGNVERTKARQAENLPLCLWLKKAQELLLPGGKISFIYPAKEMPLITMTAEENELSLHRLCRVKSNPSKAPHRVLIELSKETNLAPTISELCIRQAHSNDYHESFSNLCAPFYLGI